MMWLSIGQVAMIFSIGILVGGVAVGIFAYWIKDNKK